MQQWFITTRKGRSFLTCAENIKHMVSNNRLAAKQHITYNKYSNQH